MSTKAETIGAEVEKLKFSANPNNLITFFFSWDLKNEYQHFVFLSTNKKVTSLWNSEVGSGKSMEKAEDIQLESNEHIVSEVKSLHGPLQWSSRTVKIEKKF